MELCRFEVALGPHLEKLSSGYIIDFKKQFALCACIPTPANAREAAFTLISPFQLSAGWS